MEVTGEAIFELKNWTTTNWAQNGKQVTNKNTCERKLTIFTFWILALTSFIDLNLRF